MANTGSAKHPADSLETTLALVLKETGKFFRASQSNDSRQVGLAKTTISHTIPVANLMFHEALDDIEIEIVRARSVFERDLSYLRTKRAERERAAAGSPRSRTPNRLGKTPTADGSPEAATSTEPSTTVQELNQKPQATARNDITEIPLSQEPISDVEPKLSPKKPENAVATLNTEPFSIPQSLPQDPDVPKGLAISLGQDPVPFAPAALTKPEAGDIDFLADSSKSSTAPAPNLSNADFESMFDEPELRGGGDEIDFDIAFPTDSVNDPTNLLDPSAFENLPLGNPDNTGTHNTAPTDEDLTTLLPGLENYVNDSNDFQLPDMAGPNFLGGNNNEPIANTNPEIANIGDGNKQQSQMANAPMIESSFEDMFGLDSYMNGTGDDELGGTGNMGEVGDFDEDWFKTDGM